jgi:arginyl-tRNA synthetase
MGDPQQILADRVRAAVAACFGDSYRDCDPLIRPSAFADLQANVALPLAKQLGRPPADVAREIAAAVDTVGITGAPEVSGPGFLNFTFTGSWIAAAATDMLADPRLGIPPPAAPQRVVVDYSCPNVAKEMHVGHLRTTIVGDAVVRILEHLGHTVIRANHLGDWGTPFGMLIEHIIDVGEPATHDQLAAGELTAFYKAARAKFDASPAFAERARLRVVALQGGDSETLRLWQLLVDDSKRYFNEI